MVSSGRKFLRINPRGKVPALVLEDEIICDSHVINELLEDKFTQIPLLPRLPVERAKARHMVMIAEQEFYPLVSALLQAKRQAVGGQEMTERIAQITASVQGEHLPGLEALAASARPFFLENLTLADIAYATALDAYLGATQTTLQDFPHTKQWFREVEGLPAFAASCRQPHVQQQEGT